jgi:hypothetical protein
MGAHPLQLLDRVFLPVITHSELSAPQVKN